MNDQAKVALVAFNLTVIALMLTMWLMDVVPVGMSVYMVRLGISLVVGGVVAAIAYFVAQMANK